jgi:hypothetical protein
MLKIGVLKIELLKLGKTDLQKQSSSLVLEIELGLKYSVFGDKAQVFFQVVG